MPYRGIRLAWRTASHHVAGQRCEHRRVHWIVPRRSVGSVLARDRYTRCIHVWVQLTGLLARIACGSGRSGRLGIASDAPPKDGGTGDSSYCGSPLVSGGTFFRSYDGTSEYPDMSFPSTVSTYRARPVRGDSGPVPSVRERRDGHAAVPTTPWRRCAREPRGQRLGPDMERNAQRRHDHTRSALELRATVQSWTEVPGSNESLPINCITWLEAMAFCAWDDG